MLATLNERGATMLDELIAELKKYDRAEIAYKSGVSLSTLNNIMSGFSTNPTIKTVQMLRDFLDSKKGEKQ